MKPGTMQSVPDNAQPDLDYRRVLDAAIADTLRQARKIITGSPALLVTVTKIFLYQKKAARTRRTNERQGLLVPPVMIASITSRCNLACAGCYMKAKHHSNPDMSPDQLRTVVREAACLGVSIIVIAGGEPLLRKDEIIRLAHSFPQVLFPVFTNGLVIDENMADEIAGLRNIVPVISFEGFRDDTDARRGGGVYDLLLDACSLLKSRNIFFGCSVTTSRANFGHVMDEAFIRQMIDAGVRVFTFVEYVPMEPGTEDLVLAPEQKTMLNTALSAFNRKFSALFIGFPGDEEPYSGCLAAGRGFVHISPSGDLEPCPAAPLSDANLTTVPLNEALRSRLLARIREEHGLLTESSGGCALRANREWVQEIMGRE